MKSASLNQRLERSRARQLPLLMAVVNTTPDSFFDGGRYLSEAAAQQRVEGTQASGADIIDVGAESTRPGAAPVSAEEQLRRLQPALVSAQEVDALVSVDTTDPAVAAKALQRGASIVNDVSCLRNPELADVAARHDAWLVISHTRGTPEQMRGFGEWPDSDYQDVVRDVAADWKKAAAVAQQRGVPSARLIFDPGLGFAKNARHCFELLARLEEFKSLGVPILVGPSRKSFIASVDPSSAEERLGGTIASSIVAAQRGADILRVHDVREVRQALRVMAACRPAVA